MPNLLSAANLFAFFGEEPLDQRTMILLCLVPLLLSIGIFWFCSKREAGDRLFKMRITFAAIPLAIGLLISGFRISKFFFDKMYQQYFQIGTTMLIAHYTAVLLPIVGLAAILFWNRILVSRANYDF